MSEKSSNDKWKPEEIGALSMLSSPLIHAMYGVEAVHNFALARALASLGVYVQPIDFTDKFPHAIGGQHADDAPGFDREVVLDRWYREKLKKSALLPPEPVFVGSTRDLYRISTWPRHLVNPAVGVSMGINRLAVIDCDRHAKGNTADGVRWFEENYESLGFPADMAGFPMAATPGGGLHVYARLPAELAGLNSINAWRPGVDVKLGSGFVLAADTIVAKGRYRTVQGQPRPWSKSTGVFAESFPTLPPALVAQLVPIKEKRETKRRELVSRGYVDGVDAYRGPLDRATVRPDFLDLLRRSSSLSGRAYRSPEEGAADRNRWALAGAMTREGFGFSDYVVAVEAWGAFGSSRPGKPDEARLRAQWGISLANVTMADACAFDAIDGEED